MPPATKRSRCTSTAGGGTLEAALMIIDMIDLLGVPVHARCVGRAEGAAVGIVAVAPHRSATPHARFRLGLPDVAFAGRRGGRRAQRPRASAPASRSSSTGSRARPDGRSSGSRPTSNAARGSTRTRRSRTDSSTRSSDPDRPGPTTDQVRLRVTSSGGGTRTRNLRLNSRLLCRLSYPGMASDDSKARTRPMIFRWVLRARVVST